MCVYSVPRCWMLFLFKKRGQRRYRESGLFLPDYSIINKCCCKLYLALIVLTSQHFWKNWHFLVKKIYCYKKSYTFLIQYELYVKWILRDIGKFLASKGWIAIFCMLYSILYSVYMQKATGRADLSICALLKQIFKVK